MLALVAVVVGLVVGLACGGAPSGLAGLRLRWETLILPAFVVQALSRGRLIGSLGVTSWSLGVWVTSSALLVYVMLANRKTPGMALGAAGVLMNLDVVLLNAAMPVLLGGRAVSAAEIANGSGGFYRVASSGDIWTQLADVMPIAFGDSVTLVSPGDIALAVAVVVVIVYSMSANASGNEARLPDHGIEVNT